MSTKQARLTVRVQPGASKDEVLGFADGLLRVKVAAPPLRGRANAALLALLAEVLGVSKGRLSIVKGEASRTKVIAIEGLSQGEVEGRVGKARPGGTSALI